MLANLILIYWVKLWYPHKQFKFITVSPQEERIRMLSHRNQQPSKQSQQLSLLYHILNDPLIFQWFLSKNFILFVLMRRFVCIEVIYITAYFLQPNDDAYAAFCYSFSLSPLNITISTKGRYINLWGKGGWRWATIVVVRRSI